MTWRQFKFAVITRTLLPLGVLVLRLVARTYRLEPESVRALEEMLRQPRVVMATWHGMYIQLLAFTPVPRRMGRVGCIMTSPSRDGRLLDAAIEAFGMRVVKGSSKSRSVAGSRALIQSIEAGDVAVLAVDGPRGPVTVPKPGFIGISRAAGARVYIVTGGASRALVFGSWDRMFLPLPFARLRLSIREFPVGDGDEKDTIARLHRGMLESGASVDCPIARGIGAPR